MRDRKKHAIDYEREAAEENSKVHSNTRKCERERQGKRSENKNIRAGLEHSSGAWPEPGRNGALIDPPRLTDIAA